MKTVEKSKKNNRLIDSLKARIERKKELINSAKRDVQIRELQLSTLEMKLKRLQSKNS